MRLTLGAWETSVRFVEARYGDYEDQPGHVPLTLTLSLRGRGNRRPAGRMSGAESDTPLGMRSPLRAGENLDDVARRIDRREIPAVPAHINDIVHRDPVLGQLVPHFPQIIDL